MFYKLKLALLSMAAFLASADAFALFNSSKTSLPQSCYNINYALNANGCILSSTRSYAGKRGSMQLKLYTNDSGAQAYDQPIIVVAPYPGALLAVNNNSDAIYQDLDLVFRNAFMGASPSEIKARYPNSDIFLFAYEYEQGKRFGSGDHIQLNAFTVLQGIEMINEANQTNNHKPSISVLGTSLGGVVSKYAIGYAHKYGIETNIRTWVTIDSPLKGANIPLAYQRLPLFIDSMLDDFGSIGVISLSTFDFLTSALDYTPLFFLELSELTSEAKRAIRDIRSMVQVSYENIHSTSSKQLLINHIVDKNGSYRSTLLRELDSMPLPNDIRKVVFTNASLVNSYNTPSNWNASKFIVAPHSGNPGELEAADFTFKENTPNGNRNESLFKSYTRVDRPFGNDKHVKEDTKLNEFPYYQYVNSAPGTNIGLTRSMLNTINNNILEATPSHPAYARCHNCQEPNFIPTFSALDIDPAVYGTDLNRLKGASHSETLQKLEAASPFDRIHHVNSRTHDYEFNASDMSKLDSELQGRHDLAYLIPVISNLLN
ncbi:hypothetical protein [Pseudoalteromonas sp. McH1-42]|uniref:PGAP1-like alpha/beta domain-containing protein n=1 Tax=Pseudoalteromonas sp. McH1-42 TaxID=2917752 RepID=UPI001EF53640|nr:hypothetical protein [Pseudoalteromonas sp. McH1-42]